METSRAAAILTELHLAVEPEHDGLALVVRQFGQCLLQLVSLFGLDGRFERAFVGVADRVAVVQTALAASVAAADGVAGPVGRARDQVGPETAGQAKRGGDSGKRDEHILDHILRQGDVAEEVDGDGEQLVDVSLVEFTQCVRVFCAGTRR